MLNLRSLGLTSTLLAAALTVQAQQIAAIRGRVTTSDGRPSR